MTEFEDWFKRQDFYLNMRQIYGNQLFSRDSDRYRSMHVHIAYLACVSLNEYTCSGVAVGS